MCNDAAGLALSRSRTHEKDEKKKMCFFDDENVKRKCAFSTSFLEKDSKKRKCMETLPDKIG